MKQLLIVNSAKALNAGASTPKDLSGLQAGAICFFELGSTSFLAAAAKKNFGIALGRPNNQAPIVIPEVDVNTLQITKTRPVKAVPFSKRFTFPTPVVGKEYTVILVKKDVVHHQRNTWSVTIKAGSTTAATEATAIKNAIEAKLGDYFTVSLSTAQVTITAKNAGEQWDFKLADNLSGVTITTLKNAVTAVGDRAYIEDLAVKCAAGKGYTDTDAEGRELYKYYPDYAEDVVLDDSGSWAMGSSSSNGYKYSTGGYELFTLRFQVGRDSAKTRDEKVWQIVHIALPLANASVSTIEGILPEGDFAANMVSNTAAATVTTMVKATSLNE